MKRAVFKFLSGDVNWSDYGGKWWRRVAPGRYHVIELLNWRDACGDDAEFTYNVDLSEIDLNTVSDAQIKSAFDSCGWDGDEDFLQGENGELGKVECLHGYGSKAPLWSDNGNNFSKLLKEARAESAALDDPEAHEAALNRPVNKLGSTAREFAQGDINSAVVRGVAAGDTSAKTVAKLYGASDESIAAVESKAIPVGVSFSCNLRKVPSDDPLAYMTGFSHAMAGNGLAGERKELADAYVEGYKLGVDVKAGRTEKPEWVGR